MLDLKYRPLLFSSVLGQEHIKTILKSRILNKNFGDTSYVISGPHGSGKTTLARIFARAMLCENPENGEPCNKCSSCTSFLSGNHINFNELDAAGHGTIEWVRSVVDNAAYNLFSKVQRIILFDESHRMSKEAQDVLLKSIEEKEIICIFCTTEPQKLRPAIRSRCETFGLEVVQNNTIVERLESICKSEGIEYEPKALNWITDACKGHIRDSIKYIEQVSKSGPVDVVHVKQYVSIGWSTEILALIESILADSTSDSINIMDQLILNISPQDIYAQFLENIVNLLNYSLKRVQPNSAFDVEKADQILSKYSHSALVRLLSVISKTLRFLDKSTLICEIILWTEKYHRNEYVESKPAIASTVNTAKKILDAPVAHDPEALTQYDHIAMNPAKRLAEVAATPRNGKRAGVDPTKIYSRSEDFAKAFSGEWGK